MDGSDKSFSSTTPIKPSATPKFSESDAGETNENNQSNHQTDSKLQNPKKTTAKNFMSPTISAASKTVVQKKKILAERNEVLESNFSHTHLQKTPNLDSKPPAANLGIHNSDVPLSRVTPPSSQVSEFDDDEQNTFAADSSSKPYDPLTNYLSPRPKFLRYKPNRRREIFLRERNDGLSVNRSVSFDSKMIIEEETSGSSSQEGSVDEEDEETEEIDEENEEVEEERCCSLKGALKTLLIFVVLVLSTSYISSMNSPTPSAALQTMWDLKDEYVKIQNHIFGAFSVKSYEGGSKFLNQTEETQMGLERAVKEMAKNADELDLEAGGSEAGQMVEDENKRTVREMGEVVKLQAEESEDVCDHEMKESGNASYQMDENIELPEVESEEKLEYLLKKMSHWADHHNASGDVSNQMDENIELPEVETEEQFESLQDYQISYMFDWADHHNVVSDVVNAFKKEVNADACSKDEKVADEGDEEEKVILNEMERMEDSVEKTGKVIISERMGSEDTNREIINIETEENWLEELIENTEIESISRVVAGAFILLAVVASLVLLGLYFKRKKISAKDSLPSTKTCSEYVTAEKSSSVLPNERKFHTSEKVNSFMNSMEEASKEFYESRAPTVELLGEFVVGEISSSLKSCRMKSKMIESEEESNSVSQERSQNKVHMVPIHAQPILLEFSSMGGSPSYGSFTAEEKIAKKEEGRDGKVKKVVATPVRRSGRIRNRTVLSP